jgi:hypothetical protein
VTEGQSYKTYFHSPVPANNGVSGLAECTHVNLTCPVSLCLTDPTAERQKRRSKEGGAKSEEGVGPVERKEGM